MPRRNRVDPFGNIVAHPARGMLMGNRGCLHDDRGLIVRSSDRPGWICCEPEWPGVRRQLASPGRYTELFFLDEATAMAAGHRPCGECRPERLAAFKRAWLKASASIEPARVAVIDAALRSSDAPRVTDLRDLPEGAMVANGESALLFWRGRWQRWSFNGYTQVGQPQGPPRVLTSTAMIAVLRAGYEPLVHSSAAGWKNGGTYVPPSRVS